jgi:TrkA domain protein
MELFETKLPGIGVRYEFTTEAGDRVGVVVRRDGKRDVAIYDRADPDSCRGTIELSEGDAGRLAELLGGTTITERLEELRHTVEGLAIEWVTMPKRGGLSHKTIADGKIRTATSASVVAVIRHDHGVPGPGPSFEFLPGDVVLVMGDSKAVNSAAAILTGA